MRTHGHDLHRTLAALSLIALLAAPAGAAASTTGKTGSAAAQSAPATAAMVMPWIEDDYGKAIAAGKTRQVPIFVESWAPW